MAVKYPDGHYVYIHIRNDNGKLFYVGRGVEYRAWTKWGRNKKWTNIHKKHGHSVEIIAHGLTREESNKLEIIIIELAKALGFDLANKTSGGDGCSELMFNEESKIKMSRSQGGKKVYCSNGLSFDTGRLASDWCRENGFPRALPGHILACCRNERTAAYGHSWWYEGDETKEYIPRYERMSDTRSTKVLCSNGMVFKNQRYASEWLRQNGYPNATQSGVGQAIRGVIKKYHGFEWKNYDD